MRGTYTGDSARDVIRERIITLARVRGIDANELSDSEVLAEAGILDSAGMLELIMWFETTFDVSIEQADLTLEKFGTVDAMVRYLQGA